jgi:hypothetical protein
VPMFAVNQIPLTLVSVREVQFCPFSRKITLHLIRLLKCIYSHIYFTNKLHDIHFVSAGQILIRESL